MRLVIGMFGNIGKLVGSVNLGVGALEIVWYGCEKGNFDSSKSTCLLVITLCMFGS